MKLVLVVGELLKSTNSRSGSKNRDQVSGSHLRVYELCQRLANRSGALERKGEIVYHQSDRPAHLIGLQPRRRRWRLFGIFVGGPFFGRWFFGSGGDKRKVCYSLRLLVLKYLEVVLGEVGNVATFVISDRDIELNQGYADLYDVALACCLSLRGLRLCFVL